MTIHGNFERSASSKNMADEPVTSPARETIDIDATLVRRARSGDSAAFGKLVLRYQDRVYNACYRLCGRRDDAEDLTQTAFVKAYEALPRFEAKSSFYTWLFRIAVNLAISHRRSRGRRKTISLDGGNDDRRPDPAAADEDTDVAKTAERSELREHLSAALAELDHEFRAVVVLKDIENMDYATISQVLDLPLGTVKSRLHRGRMALRERLTRSGVQL